MKTNKKILNWLYDLAKFFRENNLHYLRRQRTLKAGRGGYSQAEINANLKANKKGLDVTRLAINKFEKY